MRRFTLCVVVLLALGCDDGTGADGDSADGGSADGGSADGGSADGGSADGGSADGGSADGGGAVDAGPGRDAALPMDAAVAEDAAMEIDAGGDAGPLDAGPSSARQLAREPGYMSAPRGFWEYLPPSYAGSGAGSPLMIFLHGLGENGDGSSTQLDRVLRGGPPRFIDRDEWPAGRPFIVLSPQQQSGCPSASDVHAFLTWALATYNVDRDRVYLTGLSCGAIGTANYLRAHVDTTIVAAAVMISGDMRAAWAGQGCALGRVAIWGIHGDADRNAGTPPDGTRIPMESLIACTDPAARDPRLNMLAGVGHSGAAWNDTYSLAHGLDIYQYMLDNHR